MPNRTCAVEDCSRPVHCKGKCKTHYQRAWYEANREQALAYAKARYDPEAQRERHARLKDDPEYRAKRKASYDRWRAEHPDRMAAATRRWRDQNADAVSLSVRATGQRRRAEKVGPVVDPLRVADYRKILVDHGLICHICETDIDSLDDLHFDHVVPLSKGGEHVVENIRPAHALCNLQKGDRVPK